MSATLTSPYTLLDDVSRMGNLDPDYYDKMVHYFPKTAVLNRRDYIFSKTRYKRIVDLGCTGAFSKMLHDWVGDYHGIDIEPNPGFKNYHQVNFDTAESLPPIDDVQIVIASEVIEHLSNAGHFLDLMHIFACPVILTTPNAYSLAAAAAVRRGYENVSKYHTCWYSYQTLKVLVERHGWLVVEWFWYGDKNAIPGTAEGLIFYMEAK